MVPVSSRLSSSHGGFELRMNSDLSRTGAVERDIEQ
ncbi:hypothetical protein L195_g048976, partial [Trifolium pratense]